MYLDHFGLQEPPFRITPHTEFFFAGANRGATLDALIYAITHDEGIVKVSGEVGSGKTMLCRVLLERLPKNVVSIYLATPSLTRDDILFALADELRIEIPQQSRSAQIIRLIQEHLIELYAEGKQVVVMIDEAHAMPVDSLEEIRLLSNLESNRHKLLQLVLFGQPELNDVLARTDMRQLKERITHNFTLEPLIREDIAEYIDFRMRAAGYKGPNVFTPSAIGSITKTSLGLTRRINILADKALLAAFAKNSHEVGNHEVQAAIKDCDFSPAVGTKPPQRKLAIAAGLVGISIAGVFALNAQHASAPAAYPVPSASTAPAVVESKPTAPTTTQAPQTTTLSAPVATENKATPKPADLAPKAPQDNYNLGKLTRERYTASQTWLQAAPDNRWFIQLVATDIKNPAVIEQFLQKVSGKLAAENTRVYIADSDRGRRIGVIYGDFDNTTQAKQDIKKMPKEALAVKPYPRQVIKLR